jgi:hypothetical protein
MNYSDKLNEFDILDLLNEYQSEMRKLKHKVGYVKDKMKELERQLELIKGRKEKQRRIKSSVQATTDVFDSELVETAEALTAQPKKRGRKKKEVVAGEVVVVASTPKKVKEPKAPAERKKPGRKQQELSVWDRMIYDSIVEKGKPMISKEIFEAMKTRAVATRMFQSDEDIRVRQNQCLVKMTSKRDDLVKYKFIGRGFAYGLKEWGDELGNLRPEFEVEALAEIKKEPKKLKAKVKKTKAVKAKKAGTRKRITKKAIPQVEPEASE